MPLKASAVAASLASNLFALAVPIALLQVYDRVIPNAGTATLSTLAIGLVIFGAADFAVRISRGHLIGRTGLNFEVAAHDRAIDRLFHAGADPFWRGSGAALTDRFAAIETLRRRHAGEAGLAVLDLPFIVVFLGVLFVISPAIAAAVLAVTAVAAITVWLRWRRIAALSRERTDCDHRRHAFLTESLGGIEEIRSLGAEASMARRYERLMGCSVHLTRELTASITLLQGLVGAVALIAPALVASLGAWLVIVDQMTVGGLAAAILLTGRIVQPTLRLNALMVGEHDVAAAEGDLVELLEAPILDCGGAPVRRIETIQLRDVGWDGGNNASPVLNGLSLDLRRGDCISIEGEDGSGRSTLLSILAGHRRPDRGLVLINEQQIETLDPVTLASRVALLSPEQEILPGSLAENLTAFEPGIRSDEAEALARDLGISQALAVHHSGLTTRTGVKGSHGLPKATRDGITLVAGLVKRPDLILFDEANSNLDAKIDVALLEVLRRRLPDAITVLVTYRPSFRRLAQRRFVLSDGRLTEMPVPDREEARAS